MASLLRDRLLQLLNRILRVLKRIAVYLDITRILCLHFALHDLGIDRRRHRALICRDRLGRVHRAARLTDIQDILNRISALARDRNHNRSGSVRVQCRSRNGIHGRARIRGMRLQIQRCCARRNFYGILPDIIAELRAYRHTLRFDPKTCKRIII